MASLPGEPAISFVSLIKGPCPHSASQARALSAYCFSDAISPPLCHTPLPTSPPPFADLLHPSAPPIQAALRSGGATSVDAFRTAHEVFVDRVSTRCLLAPADAPVRRAIEAILALALRYVHFATSHHVSPHLILITTRTRGSTAFSPSPTFYDLLSRSVSLSSRSRSLRMQLDDLPRLHERAHAASASKWRGELRRAVVFVLRELRSAAEREARTELLDLCRLLDFNHFYQASDEP